MAAVGVKVFVSLCIFIVVLSTSWFIAVLLDYYSADNRIIKDYPASRSRPFPNDKLQNIFWFVQVSDIHLSKFRPANKAEDLKVFVNENIKGVIKPAIVLVTGDITDAKDLSLISSDQLLDEWEQYKRILDETKVTHHTVWLDVRGNHDAFSVASLDSNRNYFSHYSASGPQSSQGSSSYQHIYQTSFGSYSFNALDACPNPGPRRPFNFFGVLDQERILELQNVAKSSHEYNKTIWFGHYPMSTIINSQVKDIVSSGSVYLCGHLHTLGGIINKMHAVQPEGHLQLELGDWTVTRRYRIVAVDHDLLSFTDVNFGTWPVILITNPKDAHYLMPSHEPLHRINKSTHIRMLVFSPDPLISVSVSLDDSQGTHAFHVSEALFVLPWEPQDYAEGLHSITVEAKDTKGRTSTVVQQFSVDGTRPHLDLIPAMVLLTDFTKLVVVLFWFSFIVIVLGLGVLRWCGSVLVTDTRLLRAILGRWLTRMALLARTDTLFYPLFLFGIYMIIGPWFIGEIILDEVGLVTVHGIYVKGRWIPGSLTYVYGISQLVTFNLPLTIYLCYCLGERHQLRAHIGKTTDDRKLRIRSTAWKTLKQVFVQGGLVAVLLWQASSCYHVFKAYGLMAFLLSPAKTWSIVLALVLVRRVHNINV